MNPADTATATAERPLITAAGRPLIAAPNDATPLAVSTASKTKKGDIRLKFSKAPGVAPVECTGIVVTIPVGATAADLTGNPGSINYSHSHSGNGNWSIGQSPDKATYTCTPPPPSRKFTFDEQAQFTLVLTAIPVSRLPGQAPLAVDAVLTSTDTPTEEDWTVPITKSVDDFFFFRSFSCVEPQIPNPGTVTLRWEGSEAGTEYYLSYNGVGPQKVTGQSTQIAGLTDTTTFVLDARTANADDPDGEPGHHYLSTTVTVKEPTIHARTLTATDEIAVPGTFTADGGDKTTTAHGPAFFEGDVTIMADNKLTVNGSITSDSGTVTIDAAVRAAAATVASLNAQNGEIRTTGALNTGAASVGSLDARSGQIATTGALAAGAATVSSLDARSGEIKTTGALNTGAASVGSLDARSGQIRTAGALAGGSAAISGTITSASQRVIRVGDRLQLEVNSHNKELYLYCETGSKDNVYGGRRRNDEGVTLSNTLWRVHHFSSSRTPGDSAEDRQHPADPTADAQDAPS